MTDDSSKGHGLKKETEALGQTFDRLQRKLSNSAKEAGYARDIFFSLSSSLDNLPEDPLLDVAETSLHAYRKFVEAKEAQHINQLSNISSQAFVLATSTAVSGTAVSFDRNLPIFKIREVGGLPNPPSWTPDRDKTYAERLSKLDPELAKTYRSVWETLHGTTDSSERGALFAMRQVFDHFFRLLAPDEDVRNSRFFEPKKSGDPLQVHRIEKIKFAAGKHIQDTTLSQSLEAQAEHMLELYNRLNKAHSNKPLPRNDIIQLLIAIRGVIEEWIDAIGL